MDYIYDIVLNFQNNYYEFYEWKTTDKIINVKKILVYLVSNQDYLNLKYNEVILDKKILPKQIKMFLVTNGIEVMGLLLDSAGKVIKRSSLLLDEADDILEDKETIKRLNQLLDCTELCNRPVQSTSRDKVLKLLYNKHI